MLCQLLKMVVSGNQQKEMKMKIQEGLRSLEKLKMKNNRVQFSLFPFLSFIPCEGLKSLLSFSRQQQQEILLFLVFLHFNASD